MRKSLQTIAFAAILCGTAPAAAQRDETADRAAIHELLMDYGRTLDSRDFEGFSDLFTEDGHYNGTPGPEAGEMMRQVFAANASGAPEPNYHVFFNEVVTFDGPDEAHATSMSFWVVPGENNRPVPLMMGAYEDEIVRVDGKWKFKSRKVSSPLNPPASAAQAAE